MNLKLPLLIYDDQCMMCTRFKQGLERLDLNNIITYVPMTDEDVFKQFPQLNLEDCKTKVHLIKENGEIVFGSAVITEVIRVIPAVGKLAWLLDTEVGKSAATYFYDHVENIRKKLKEKDQACGSCR